LSGISTFDVTSADSGFRPEITGFTSKIMEEIRGRGLTPEEIQIMFGDQVCVGDVPAPNTWRRRWMEEANEAMNGSHCDGMAVLSLLCITI
jgi:hypothetical protein